MYDIQNVLLKNIDVDNELLKLDYLDDGYNIFDACNINIYQQLYESRNLQEQGESQAGGNKKTRTKWKISKKNNKSKSKANYKINRKKKQRQTSKLIAKH